MEARALLKQGYNNDWDGEDVLAFKDQWLKSTFDFKVLT